MRVEFGQDITLDMPRILPIGYAVTNGERTYTSHSGHTYTVTGSEENTIVYLWRRSR